MADSAASRLQTKLLQWFPSLDYKPETGGGGLFFGALVANAVHSHEPLKKQNM